MTATIRRLMLLTDVRRTRLALAALFGVLTILCGVGLMATAGYLISRAAEHPAVLSLTAAIVGVRFFGLMRPLARYLERLASHDVALRSLGRARAQVYEAVEPLAPAQIEDTRRGDLLSRFVADVDSLQNLYLRGLEPPLIALIAGGASVALAAVFLPAAGLVLACGLLLGGIAVPATAASLSRRSSARYAQARGALAAELVETLAGSAELAAFGLERARVSSMRRADSRLVRISRRAALADGLGDGLRLLITGATVVGVLAVSVQAHSDGRLDRVLIALLALLSLAAFEAVQPLTESFRELQATVAAGRRVLDLTDRDPRIVDPAQPLPAPVPPFSIELDDVRARYLPGEQPALDGFSLRLEPGRRVVLLGPSGAGKTTVVRLLQRFVDPERGRVTLAGEDLRRYRQEDVRRLIAVAGQDAHLFSTSIRQNVLIGCPGASDARVEDALRRARIWDWVAALPDGVETYVGEAGAQLSGGQRQRVALARALLSEAPVLVLDEPTAHLDSPTAKELMDDVFAAAGSRTVLLITHRPEGLEHVGSIVTLERGRLQAADPHAAQSSAA
jgi:thiol reductant ABC exporter CydC subunit